MGKNLTTQSKVKIYKAWHPIMIYTAEVYTDSTRGKEVAHIAKMSTLRSILGKTLIRLPK